MTRSLYRCILLVISIIGASASGLLHAQSDECVVDWTSIKRMGDSEHIITKLDSINEVCHLEGAALKEWLHLSGMHCIYLARYDKAQEYFQKGLILSREMEQDTFQAIFTNQLGVLKYSTKQREASMKWFKEAGELAHEYEMIRLEAISANNLGAMYIEAGVLDTAELYLERALEIWKSLGAKAISQYLFTSRLLATNAETQKDFDKAIKMYNRLIKASLLHNDSGSYYRALNFKSLCETKIGRTDSALYHARISLDHFSRDSSSKENLIMSLDVWGNANQVAGNFEVAMLAREELRRLDKEIFSENLDNQLAEKEAEFNTDSERQQRKLAEAEAEAANQKLRIYGISIASLLLIGLFIGLIYWQRQKRKQAEQDTLIQKQRLSAVIEGEERERTRIARELHDGVSQLLGALKINLHASGVEDIQSLKLLDDGINEVRSISHNLLPKQLNNQGLAAAIQSMIDMLDLNDGTTVRLAASKDSEPKSELLRTNVYRICQELLTNALKYSQASEINFSLNQSDSILMIEYSDNGIGMDVNQLKKAAGIGWKNIMARLQLINGQFSSVEVSKGFCLRFHIPNS